MKKIKVSFILILLIVLISSITYSNAKIGDKIDDVLYTDIITEINGQEVESFNINGSTAIYVTEAKKLGYKVNWDGDNRLVTIINDEAIKPAYIENKLSINENNNHQIGDKINDVLYTDIQTKINANEVDSFNINGSTAIFVTAFKEIPGVTVTWNSDQRKVVVASEVIETVEDIEEEIINGDGETKEVDGLKLVKKNDALYLPNENKPYTGVAIWYHDGGQIKTKANLKNGKFIGKMISYYENGQIELIENYIDDELNGEAVLYYESGEVKGKFNNIDGKLEGEGIGYYENGEVKAKLNFIDGKLEGEAIHYHENGEVKAKTNFVDGLEQGEAIYYSNDGEVEFRKTFKDGEIVD